MSFPFIIFTVALLTQQIVLSIPAPQPNGQGDNPLDSPDVGNDFIGGVARMSRMRIPPSSPNSSPDDNDLENNLIPRNMEVGRFRSPPASGLLEDRDQFGRLPGSGLPRPPSFFRHSTREPLPTTKPRHSFLPTPPDFPTSFMNVRRDSNEDISTLVNSDYRQLHPDAPDDEISRQADVIEPDPLPEMVETQRLPLAPFQRIRDAPSVGDWISRWIFRPILSPFGV